MLSRFAVFTTMFCAAVLSSTPNLQAQKSEVKNIVVVNGAWADGSGWRGVYNNLVRDDLNVSIAQEPETSFQDDVTAVKRILALQDGPSILVAHSYEGSVVTKAGTDPSVAGLINRGRIPTSAQWMPITLQSLQQGIPILKSQLVSCPNMTIEEGRYGY